MTRVAFDARDSSDLQREASIEDQFRICRAQAEREGWTIAGNYHDAAVSGAGVLLMPGVQALLEDARRGGFDLVLAEALDRVSRDQADVATVFKAPAVCGRGDLDPDGGADHGAACGPEGTMNALFVKDLAAKPTLRLRECRSRW